MRILTSELALIQYQDLESHTRGTKPSRPLSDGHKGLRANIVLSHIHAMLQLYKVHEPSKPACKAQIRESIHLGYDIPAVFAGRTSAMPFLVECMHRSPFGFIYKPKLEMNIRRFITLHVSPFNRSKAVNWKPVSCARLHHTCNPLPHQEW